MEEASPATDVQPGDDPRVVRLIADAREGVADAFDELVFLHRDAVWKVAYRSTRDHDTAMDVVQDVFVRAWRSLSAFSGRSKFSTWLHRVAVNVCIDHARRRQREERCLARQAAEQHNMTAPLHPPENVAMEAELSRRVAEALLALSLRQREAFMLRYYSDLPLQEIATSMKCSEGAVKRHLFRATARLRELIG